MNWEDDPLLKHDKLTPGEMGMICDVCNPGFRVFREHAAYCDELVAASLLTDVADSFRLYPGTYEEKWGIDSELIQKLSRMPLPELIEIANRVDAFWEQT